MHDMTPKTVIRELFKKDGVVPAGTTVKITVGNQTIYEKTVPTGKKFRGSIIVNGKVEDA